MEEFYVVEPEVPGGFGENSELDTSVVPPQVTRLHFEFAGWLGGEIFESYPIFLVTTTLGADLSGAGFTGFVLDDVEVTMSEQYSLLCAFEPPPCRWFKVVGVRGQDDFSLTTDVSLVVSARVLAFLRARSAPPPTVVAEI